MGIFIINIFNKLKMPARKPTKAELWGGIATYCMTLQMLLAIFIAKPMAPVAKAQLGTIKRQFGIVIIKFVLFCFFACWAGKLHKKGTPAELKRWLFLTFLISPDSSQACMASS